MVDTVDEKAKSTDEKPVDEKKTDENSGTSEKEETQFATLEDAIAEVNRLKEINTDVISSRDKAKQKVHSYEATSEKAEQEKIDALKEQGKYEELYVAEKKQREGLEAKMLATSVDADLTKALEASEVNSVTTAMKLIDRDALDVTDGKVSADSIADAITNLKEEHDVLFIKQAKPGPKPKRAGEDTPNKGYAEELKLLRGNSNTKPIDLQKLRAKYGRT